MVRMDLVKKNQYLILLLLLMIGIWLRIAGTLKGYFAFTYDQGRDFLTLSQLLNKKFTLIGPPTGIDGVFHGVWWFYFLLPVFYITGGNPQLVVLGFSILASVSIILAYLVGRQIQNYQLGLVLAGLTSVSPYFVSIAAQLWHPNVIPMLILLLYLVMGSRLGTGFKWGILGWVLGAIFEFEFASGGLLVVAVIISAWMLQVRWTVKKIIVSSMGFAFWLLPRLIFEFRHDFIQLKSLFDYLSGYFSPTLLESSGFSITKRIFLRLKTYFGVFKHFVGMDKTWLSWVFLLLIGIFFGGRYHSEDKIPQAIKFSLLTTSVILVLALFYPDNLWDYYLISLPALFLVFMGWVIYKFIKIKRWVAYGMLVIVSMLIFRPIFFEQADWTGDAAVYKNQIAVVKLIYQDAQKAPFNLEIFSPSLIAYNYQYLFSWMGEKQFGYLPETDKVLKDVYYIVEPDLWNKGLRKKWLADHQHDGEIVWEKNLPGEIMVQKRLRNLNPK